MSASLLDWRTGRALLSIDDRVAMPTASLGRILLLIEVSARLTARDAAGFGILERSAMDDAAGAGLWRHPQAPVLPLVDLAVLVGALGDDLASNTLLRQIGLEKVRARTESLGLVTTSLLDRVRDSRGPDDAPHPSVGAAAELTWLLTALSRGQIVDHTTSRRALDWLGHGVDLLEGPRGGIAYALTVRFADTSLARRREVLGAMRVFGLDLLEHVA